MFRKNIEGEEDYLTFLSSPPFTFQKHDFPVDYTLWSCRNSFSRYLDLRVTILTRRGEISRQEEWRDSSGNQSYHKFAVKESNTLTRHFIAQRSASLYNVFCNVVFFTSLSARNKLVFFLTPLDCEGRISRPKTEMGRSPKIVGRASYVTRGMKQRSHACGRRSYVSGM